MLERKGPYCLAILSLRVSNDGVRERPIAYSRTYAVETSFALSTREVRVRRFCSPDRTTAMHMPHSSRI
jgi:hypothetical protein